MLHPLKDEDVELTIEITGWCDKNCDFCSSDATEEGKPLSFETIQKFLMSYVGDGMPPIKRINVSGGEPLSHPDFFKIWRLCKSICQDVVLYTNEIEHIAFNAFVVKEVKVRANVCLVPGIHIYIPKSNFVVHILKFIQQGRGKTVPTAKVTCSGNILDTPEKCAGCNQPVLLSDGTVAVSPCKKEVKK